MMSERVSRSRHMSLEQTEPLVTFTHTHTHRQRAVSSDPRQTRSTNDVPRQRFWPQIMVTVVTGGRWLAVSAVSDRRLSGPKRTLCLWAMTCRSAVDSLSALDQIRPEKRLSKTVFRSCDKTDSDHTHGYFGPNYVPRAIMTQEENYARTAANSFTIISAHTSRFSSCLFRGRTSTYGNERVRYYFLVAHNVAISLRWLPASLSVGDRHKPFHRMLIWRAISLQVGVVARALTSSHCCISISH